MNNSDNDDGNNTDDKYVENTTSITGDNNIVNNYTIQTGDDSSVNNDAKKTEKTVARYTVETKLKSNITKPILDILTVVSSIITIISFVNISLPVINLFQGNINREKDYHQIVWIFILIICLALIIILVSLSRVAKKQIRVPLIMGYAVNGMGRKLTFEKIIPGKCPVCNADMKYYNKAVEYSDIVLDNGKVKRKVIRKVPALECERNAKHWYEIDPAEEPLSDETRVP